MPTRISSVRRRRRKKKRKGDAAAESQAPEQPQAKREGKQGKRRSPNGKAGEEPARDAGGERLAGASEPA